MNILITGHTNGIGNSILKRFESENHRVYGISRNLSDLIDSSKQLKVDLSELKSIEIARNWLSNINVDVFFHCAGSNLITSFKDSTSEVYLKSFNLHFLSASQISRVILENKKNNSILKIILFSSIWSKISAHSRGPYSVAKSALNSLAKQIAIEHASDNVQAISLALGFVETDLTKLTKNDHRIKNAKERYLFPKNKFPKSDQVAKLISEFAFQDLSMVNGNTLNFDGGITLQ